MGKKREKNTNFIPWAVAIVVLVIIIAILFAVICNLYQKSRPASVILTDNTVAEPVIKKFEITVDYLNRQLNNISELSTAEIVYTGICTVEEGDIPFINKKGFSMLYKGKVKAGIDASEINIDITDKEVIITLPRATVQDRYIDPESIQFYDEKKALFNWTEKSDSVNAIILAEQDMLVQAQSDSVLEKADSQAEYIVRGLLEDIVKNAEGERSLKIVRAENTVQ